MVKRICVLLLCLLLTGCGREDPYRVDTVIRIPVDPTEEATEVATEPTAAPTEAPTEAPTQPPQTTPPTQPPKPKPEPTEPPETRKPRETEGAFDPGSYSPGSLEKKILQELNANGDTELTLSRKLSGIAALRARELTVSWSHTRPDGRDYKTVLTDYGYGYGRVTEKLLNVPGKGDAAAIAASWLRASPEDFTGGEYTKAGIGLYRTGGYTYVCCILVG